MDDLKNTRLAAIVTNLPHSVRVFEKYQLDFCCQGKQTLSQACETRGLSIDIVVNELAEVSNLSNQTLPVVNTAEMTLGELMDIIIARHHAYVRESLGPIQSHVQKIAKVHGDNHPELREMAACFADVVAEMGPHMMAEENVLFPFIREMEHAVSSGLDLLPPVFGTVRNPVAMMEAQHESAGGLMTRIRFLSLNYSVPDDGCATYRVAMQELKKFELDLHQHVHLENNILFPKAVAMEKQLQSTNTIQ